ncbi:MAG: glycerol-3-phosphate acyltransferase [Nevskia sp.]|nr:glycerol-3-phosphate acyltransferase [Nevskia sp.]
MNGSLSSILRSRKSYAREVLKTDRFRKQLELLARRLKRPLDEVKAEATIGLEEIVTVQNPMYSAMFDHGLGPMHTRAWTVAADRDELRHLKRLNAKNPLVFLPTHRSYADAFILTKVLRENGLPRNHILGGNNLGFFPLGTIIRRAGGVLVRRSFKDDEVYKLVVREYLGYLVAQGRNLEWYMEGGRSRTGKLRPPKYGLLRYLVDAIESGVAKDMLLVPVAITYDQLHEVGVMAAEEAGTAKTQEGLRWLAGYARGQQKWIGTAFVRFGEALSLREALQRADSESGGSKWTVEKIAFEVFQRINRVTPVTAPALVTLALLGVRDRALTLPEVRGLVDPLLEFAVQRGFPSGQLESLNDDTGLLGTLAALAKSGVVRCHESGAEPVYGINPGQHSVAAFYRNSAIHWFVNRALTELALVSVDGSVDGDPLQLAWEKAFALRDLLKFDFFFSDRQTFRDEIKTEARLLDAEFRDHVATPRARRQLLRKAPFLIAHRVLPAFLEAYFIVAERLAMRPANQPVDQEALVNECYGVGRQYLLQHRLHSPEAISRELYRNALLLAANRGLLPKTVAEDAGQLDELALRRRAFATELEMAVKAVNAIDELEQSRLKLELE